MTLTEQPTGDPGGDPTGDPAAANAIDPEIAQYRYPGSPPFADNELHRILFQGRADEAQNVLHSILSSDLFLLYSVSGLGKSSLLNAGVVQSLRERDHWPVTLRLNQPGPNPIPGLARQIQAAAQRGGVELLNAPDAGDITEAESLWDLLASIEIWRDNELQQPVVIFDQFEELFTLGWEPDVRQRFIEDLGEVVRGHRRPGHSKDVMRGVAPPVKFVIVIREDALGELEALADEIPQVMRNRFRLDPLTDEQARAAVTAPGIIDDPRIKSPKFTFTEAALNTLIEFLSKSSEGAGGRIGNTRTGVDPSQLQIICQFIERETVRSKAAGLPEGAVVEIDEADLGGAEGLGRILGTFYRRSVEQFPPGMRPAIQRLCETGLINADRRRLSLEEGDISARYGVDHAALQRLVHERLMRSEPRVGSVYYEIAHDTLVGPILDDRDLRENKRRRRRRKIVLWLLAILAVLLLVGLVIVLMDSSDNSIPIVVGETPQGTVGEGGESVMYSVEADREQALVVSVEPGDDLNPAVEVSTEEGVTRIQDESARGQSETIVVPPAAEGDLQRQVRVTSFDSTSGDFEVAVRTAEVTTLDSDEALTGVLTDEDPVAVYAVDTSEGNRRVNITPVTPEPSDGGSSGPEPAGPQGEQGAASSSSKLLDTRVEVIDPEGNGVSVNDTSAGREESVLLSGDGTNFVAVSSVDSLGGTFRIREAPKMDVGSAAAVGQLPPGVPKMGEVGEDVEITWVVEGSEDLPTGVVVRPDGELDPVITVTQSDGQPLWIDKLPVGAIEYVLLPPGAGSYELRIEGYDGSVGAFEIESERVEPIPITPTDSDDPVAFAQGPTTYLVETPDPSTLTMLTAQPGPSADVVAQLVIQDGVVTSGAGYVGEPARLILSGTAADSHLVTVIPSDSWSVAVSLEPIQPTPMELGEAVRAEGTSAFTAEVPADVPLIFTVKPHDAEFVFVDLISPKGGIIPAGQSSEEEPEVNVNIGSSEGGTYQVVVTPMFGQGDYEALLEAG